MLEGLNKTTLQHMGERSKNGKNINAAISDKICEIYYAVMLSHIYEL